jgi:hypothetical protein
MRKLAALALAAAIGLPICALAQPVGGDDKPTIVSELTVEAHTGQCPPSNPRWPNAVRKMIDAPPDTKAKRTEESTGTRALVLAVIAGMENTSVDYTPPRPELAKLIPVAVARLKPVVACVGAFKGIKFMHVSEDGSDDFEADFSTGALEFTVKPLDSHQWHLGATPFYPQPASRQLDDLLASMERGRPNYVDVAPDLASRLRAEWPALQTSLKAWGRRTGLRFAGQDHDGSYVYLATYEHHLVVWTTFPPNADGKLTGLTYDEKVG